jgi:broad specificity phosphatase PhoE
VIDLTLARHGESFGNLDFSHGPDSDLTDRGREQARRLGDWLVQHGYIFTALYASTLQRARQTAEIINAHYGLEIRYNADLREVEYWLPALLPPQEGPLAPSPDPPFAQEYLAFLERIMRATAQILEENPSGKILVVAHGGTLGSIVRGLLGMHALLVHSDLTALHRLGWNNGRWELFFLNRTEHLVGMSPE